MIQIQLLDDKTLLAAPQRLLRYILFWCRRGTASITIDENDFTLNTGEAITITSGQYHCLKQIKGQLYALDFTLDFFSKNDHDIELIFHNGLFCHFGMNEVIRVSNSNRFLQLLQQVEKELNEKPYQYLVSVHSYIELLLVELNRSKIDNGDEIWKPDALFLRFLEAVRNNFIHNYSVAQFANLLSATEAKLNELSKLHTNKTAQNVIYSLTISEAKRLLLYQDLSVKEIAYQLGFNDPFYFSNFFKKHTSLAPKDFKKEFAL